MSGPSGVGKTTLLTEALRRTRGVVLSLSATTRTPRRGEREGVDYLFLDDTRFDEMVASGAFLEHANYAGYRYGTPRAAVEATLATGTSVVLEIELQGARQIRAVRPDAVLIFIEPPSWEALEARLRGRATEDQDALERRLATSRLELDAAGEFDISLVNDDLEVASSRLARILEEA